MLLTHQQTLHRILHALEIIGVKYVFPKLFIITPTKLPDDKYLMIKQVFWSSVFLKNKRNLGYIDTDIMVFTVVQ